MQDQRSDGAVQRTKRIPGPADMAASMSAALATPFSSIQHASRNIADVSRLATCPGSCFCAGAA